jgi:hypothetical protein
VARDVPTDMTLWSTWRWQRDYAYAARVDYTARDATAALAQRQHWSANVTSLAQLRSVYGSDAGGDGSERAMRLLPSATYAWRPIGFSQSTATASFTLLTPWSICYWMHKAAVRRVLFVGNRASFDMMQSFWALAQPPQQQQQQASTTSTKMSNKELLACVPGGKRTLQYVSNESGNDDDWLAAYAADKTRTLVIWSMGEAAPVPDYNAYRLRFDAALARLRRSAEAARRTDILVFRTSVPGHAGCDKHRSPLRFASEYAFTAESNWDKTFGNNAHSKAQLRRSSASTQSLAVHVLDVVPMSLTRPDAHVPGDCARFSLPGVVDWWNHQLVSLLAGAQDHEVQRTLVW